jgi:hypothetical protein
MYAVVGCSECSALWIVSGSPETSQCPRCGKRREHAKRRTFVETDDEDHARDVRASMLANRQDHGDEFAELDSFSEMDRQVSDVGVDDETYLSESGVDTDAVTEASDRAHEGVGGSQSRTEIIKTALRELTGPTRAEILSFATERGVSESDAETVLSKLRQTGEVVESDGKYRLL